MNLQQPDEPFDVFYQTQFEQRDQQVATARAQQRCDEAGNGRSYHRPYQLQHEQVDQDPHLNIMRKAFHALQNSEAPLHHGS
jgi:hypothetical protein